MESTITNRNARLCNHRYSSECTMKECVVFLLLFKVYPQSEWRVAELKLNEMYFISSSSIISDISEISKLPVKSVHVLPWSKALTSMQATVSYLNCYKLSDFDWTGVQWIVWNRKHFLDWHQNEETRAFHQRTWSFCLQCLQLCKMLCRQNNIAKLRKSNHHNTAIALIFKLYSSLFSKCWFTYERIREFCLCKKHFSELCHFWNIIRPILSVILNYSNCIRKWRFGILWMTKNSMCKKHLLSFLFLGFMWKLPK